MGKGRNSGSKPEKNLNCVKMRFQDSLFKMSFTKHSIYIFVISTLSTQCYLKTNLPGVSLLLLGNNLENTWNLCHQKHENPELEIDRKGRPGKAWNSCCSNYWEIQEFWVWLGRKALKSNILSSPYWCFKVAHDCTICSASLPTGWEKKKNIYWVIRKVWNISWVGLVWMRGRPVMLMYDSNPS